MKKSLALLPKILSKEKTIESRWYKHRRSPWNQVKKNDIIYFKNSGQPVTAKAIVSKVLQFELLPPIVKKIYANYGKKIGLESSDIKKTIKNNQEKNYCILIFLKNPKSIKPFNINKAGFGLMSAWISVNNVKEIKLQT